MIKMYRLEMSDYTIEGGKETIVEALGKMTVRELYRVKLYYLIPKKFLWFSFELKQRVEDDVFSRLIMATTGVPVNV